MMKANVYLTFNGDCAKAFDLYKTVFGADFAYKATFGESPMKDHMPPEDHGGIMHVSLPLGDNLELMGCDYNPMIHKTELKIGTNTQISLSVDSKEEADRIFAALAASEGHPMKEMFWGSYFGYFTDPFGVQWMIDCALAPKDDKEEVLKAVKMIRSAARTATAAADQLDQLYEPANKKSKN